MKNDNSRSCRLENDKFQKHLVDPWVKFPFDDIGAFPGRLPADLWLHRAVSKKNGTNLVSRFMPFFFRGPVQPRISLHYIFQHILLPTVPQTKGPQQSSCHHGVFSQRSFMFGRPPGSKKLYFERLRQLGACRRMLKLRHKCGQRDNVMVRNILSTRYQTSRLRFNLA